MKKHQDYRNMCLTALLVGSFVFLGGCVTPKQKLLDQGMNPLEETAFLELFSTPIKGSFRDLKYDEWSTIEYDPDGTVRFSNDKFSDEGKWRVVNNEVCTSWKMVHDGVERCDTWFKVGENNYDVFYPDGSKSGTYTIK